MARARLITGGLYIMGSKGPCTAVLRAARKSAAACFCAASYCAGGMVGRRSWAAADTVSIADKAGPIAIFMDFPRKHWGCGEFRVALATFYHWMAVGCTGRRQVLGFLSASHPLRC